MYVDDMNEINIHVAELLTEMIYERNIKAEGENYDRKRNDNVGDNCNK